VVYSAVQGGYGDLYSVPITGGTPVLLNDPLVNPYS